MFKVLKIFIEGVFWLQFFIGPFVVGTLIGLVIYAKNENLASLSIIIAAIGFIGGVIYAAWVRRNKGTSRFAAKSLATPDIWPDENPEEKKVGKKREN